MAELTRRDVILIVASIPSFAIARASGTARPLGLGVRLAGADLSGLDLSGLNLSQADLAGADLRGSNLTDAVLRGVFAEGATFVNAKLARSDFRASERDLFYGTCLADADFQAADLSDALLIGVNQYGVCLTVATLIGADLTGARMNRRTRLNGARFDSAALDGVECAEAYGAPGKDRSARTLSIDRKRFPACKSPCLNILRINFAQVFLTAKIGGQPRSVGRGLVRSCACRQTRRGPIILGALRGS